MRFSRLVAISSVAAIALLAAGWWLTAAPQPAGARPAAAAAGPARPLSAHAAAQVARTLHQALEQLLARHPFAPAPPFAPGPLPRVRGGGGVVAPPFLPGVHGGTCYVAAGGCSLVPCVEFARSASAVAVPAPVSSAVVLDLGITARTVGPGRPAPLPSPHSSCRGHLLTPKIVRVSVP